MGTNNRKNPNLEGLSKDSTFFDSLTLFVYFKIMGTLSLGYEYNRNLYYLSLSK